MDLQIKVAVFWQVCLLPQKTKAPLPAVAVSTARATTALINGDLKSLKFDVSTRRTGVILDHGCVEFTWLAVLKKALEVDTGYMVPS